MISFKQKSIQSIRLSIVFIILLFPLSCSLFEPEYKLDYRLQDNSLFITTALGDIKYTPLGNGAIEVHYLYSNKKQLPSFSKSENLEVIVLNKSDVTETNRTLTITNKHLTAVIDKKNLTTSFYRDSQLLIKQKSFTLNKNKIGFDFTLDEKEKILGGGERVLGMNRRGHRMPLYNRAHYGYETKSNQMNFSLPAVMSSKKYTVLFDNTANGYLDIGKTEVNTLSFEAIGGRTAYIVFTGETYPELINHYVEVTGKQPMPPRWAFGNYASRFGYRNQQQVIETIDQFIEQDFPLDVVILDLYWFGNNIKGFMGNLDWDKDAFPEPIKMIETLKQKGVKTILITEPFILSTSNKWQEAVNSNILAKDEEHEPKTFDFYFGNTGLIDVFNNKAQDWFNIIYKDLTNQGVAGVWGDLGEPEVHPADSIHFISDANMNTTGDEIHNAYGHQWAKMVFENQLKLQPNTRPFILMRSGFSGSQRYGMIPWTGDVSRSWGGLKPQVELSLQMGMIGMGYTHSDLGGFAGGKSFNKELYIRWLQYGVFQPIYRPHAQDNIAPEPIFHDQQTKNILRQFVKLRYQLLAYNYTLAYENSTTGMPLMRPIFFEDENNLKLFDVKDSYLWGDAFLISPIVDANEDIHKIDLPKGVWFDYWNEQRFIGGQTILRKNTLETLPIMIRAGSFIPMVNSVQTTDHYSSENLTIHYYADSSIVQSTGKMYEDDGHTYGAIEKKQYELLKFSSHHNATQLKINLSRKGGRYQGSLNKRYIKMIIHNYTVMPGEVVFSGQSVIDENISFNKELNQLVVSFVWEHDSSALIINK